MHKPFRCNWQDNSSDLLFCSSPLRSLQFCSSSNTFPLDAENENGLRSGDYTVHGGNNPLMLPRIEREYDNHTLGELLSPGIIKEFLLLDCLALTCIFEIIWCFTGLGWYDSETVESINWYTGDRCWKLGVWVLLTYQLLTEQTLCHGK